MTGHIAFFSFPAYAHLAPTLPVVEELVRRGHRVTYAAADRFADKVAATGAEVLPYDSTFPWESGLSDDGTRAAMTETVLSFVTEALSPLPAAIRRFADDVPDLFVHDHAASETARILARKWDRPIAQTCPTFATNSRFSLNEAQVGKADTGTEAALDAADPELLEFFQRQHAMLDGYGLGEVEIDGFGADYGPNVVFIPREFQVGGDEFEERYTFVGPCQTGAQPAATWTPPADGRPVVLISLGTSYSPGRAEFFARCAQAFSGTRWHVVMTLGSALTPAELGPLPPNVEALQWVPHPAVLEHTSVFVTHAGMGSVMESLSIGVPMVCVPHHVDQRVIAGQVEALGLGRTISGDRTDAAELVEMVDAVAADGAYRQAVREMRGHLHAAGGTARAADALESCFARSPA